MLQIQKTLVIVEDDLDLLSRFQNTAKDFFSTVVCHASYHSASSYLAENHADAILLDYFLPGGHGLDLIKNLDVKLARIPVVLVTANSNKDMAVSSVNLGVTYFLEKPITKSQLVDTLKNVINLLRENDLTQSLRLKYTLSNDAKAVLTDHYKITSRELDIITHSLNHENKEDIGHALFISPNTVKTHFQNIFFKLKVSTHRELLAFIRNINQPK